MNSTFSRLTNSTHNAIHLRERFGSEAGGAVGPTGAVQLSNGASSPTFSGSSALLFSNTRNLNITNQTGAYMINSITQLANGTTATNILVGPTNNTTLTGGNNVLIGNNAGLTLSTGTGNVFIGNNTGNKQGTIDSIAIGNSAGQSNQSNTAIAIGKNAGRYSQGTGTIAIGIGAGQSFQSENSVAIGTNSGTNSQGFRSVAIGNGAGYTNQASRAVAIGDASGVTNQAVLTVAIGADAGNDNQDIGAVAIGSSAGYTNQGAYSIAIGTQAGFQNQSTNSIVINASGSILNANLPGFYVNPVNATGAATNLLGYNTLTKQIGYDPVKTFIIDHPDDTNKYLAHACLEGPEAGVYYRGKGEIPVGEETVEIVLPDYVKNLATDLTVSITPIFNGKTRSLNATEVEDNKFTVHGADGKFHWSVTGRRQDINVEIDKNNINIRGDGPYKWYE